MGKSKDLATGETRFVNTAGDTMTGDLTISSTAGQLKLTDTDGTEQNTTIKQSGGNVFIQARDNTNNAGIVFAGNGGGNYSEHMRINASGIVTMPNQPMFRVRCANNNNVDGTVSGGVILAGTGFYQSNTLVQAGSHFSISTGRFTAPVNGYYYLNFSNRLDQVGSGYVYFTILDNGGGVVVRNLTNVNTTYQTLHCSAVHYMSANDYVYVRYDAQSDAYVNHDSDGFFSGFLIG